jgi:DNA adenine methylase
MTFYSPLRYPGGKGKLANYFKQLFEENSLNQGIYVEPYVGGASIALSLLIEGYASKIIINDIDKSIFAFWYSVLNYNEELCELIKNTPLNIKTWRKQKQIQKEKENYNLLTLGFSTFFLNRTNRSGILNAGVIGGLNQKGKWKMNARYNKKDLIERIKKISLYKNKIELYNMDAVELIKMLKNKLPTKTLFYLDPPYYNKGKELYLNYYLDEDHKKIAEEINQTKKQKWIITYDDAKLIKELYSKNKKRSYSLTYSAGKSKKGNELIIFSENLKILKPMLV